jgi:anti-sigma regulatory factor (Ser/Thr protein kinase)
VKSETAHQPSTTSPIATFAIRLSSTSRGARLARRLAAQQLDAWGIPYATGTASAVAAVTAELAANAVTHGRLPGRDFELRLLLLPEAVRVEVSDARPERLPPPAAAAPALDASSGRGLLLVAAHADRWGCTRRDAFTKMVWAEVARKPGITDPTRASSRPAAFPG